MSYDLAKRITDPRVRARCETALQATLAHVSDTKPMEISTRLIDEYFGQNRKGTLGGHLREWLLIEVDSKYRFATTPDLGKSVSLCKKYTRNHANCVALHNLLYPNDPWVESPTIQMENVNKLATNKMAKYQDQLSSGAFEYNHSNNRQYHPLQNIPTANRQQLFAQYGYEHVYDIRCAAPSIIMGLAVQLGLNLQHTQYIQHYIENRQHLRKLFAKKFRCTTWHAKRFFTALFNGAPINPYRGANQITQLMSGDILILREIQSNQYITNLRREITQCWRMLRNHRDGGEYIIPRHYINITDEYGEVIKTRKKRISSKDRWDLYFDHERKVMDSVISYMHKQSAKYFIEHDGWSCNIQLDLDELTQHVRLKTHIDTIDFEYMHIKPQLQLG